MSSKRKAKLRIPDTYVLVTIFILIAAVMTFVVPAGEYIMIENPQTGLMVADPTSYHRIEQNPVSIEHVLLAIPIGMNNSASIINMLFLVSGFLQVVNDAGAIDRLVRAIIQKLKDKSSLQWKARSARRFWRIGSRLQNENRSRISGATPENIFSL